MNIKAMRNVHLYLGVFFAPLLMFFLISGCWQTFGLHEKSDSGNYVPPAIIKSLSRVHKDQVWTKAADDSPYTTYFRYLVLLMVLGLLATTVLGIVMAFKYTQGWIVWACLVVGIVLPVTFLIFACHG